MRHGVKIDPLRERDSFRVSLESRGWVVFTHDSVKHGVSDVTPCMAVLYTHDMDDDSLPPSPPSVEMSRESVTTS